MKHCPKCNEVKDDSQFYPKKTKAGKITLRSYCIECGKKARDFWRQNNPSDNERNKLYNKVHADEIRGKKLVKNYWPHLTWQEALKEWDRMFEAQGGKCAIGGEEAEILHVDHDHDTGEVRGLLCYNCNNGIGRLEESIDKLNNAIKYLLKYKK